MDSIIASRDPSTSNPFSSSFLLSSLTERVVIVVVALVVTVLFSLFYNDEEEEPVAIGLTPAIEGCSPMRPVPGGRGGILACIQAGILSDETEYALARK